jgi:undecaprenyl-diphosphatase
MLSWLIRLDHQIFLFLNNEFSSPLLDWLFGWVAILGDGFSLAIAVGIGLWWYDRRAFRRHYCWLVLAVLLGVLVTQLLKYALARPRPWVAFALLLQAGEVHVRVVGPRLLSRSFPSGHTQTAATVFTYLACLYPWWWYLWGIGILLIGASRVYVGAHFPADVLAGMILGVVNALGMWWLHGRTRRYNGESARLPTGPAAEVAGDASAPSAAQPVDKRC